MTRVLVALNAPDRNGDFIYYAKFIASCLAREPIFSDPFPPLAVFVARVAELEAAQARTLTRAHGTTGARDARRMAVFGDMQHVKNFVQGIADAHPADVAAAIVESSGMSVKRSSGHGKAEFVVKLGPVSGSVHLYVRAAKTRASYDWEYSLDGKTWIRVDSTVRADTILRNLAPRTRYFFRFRRVTKEGVGDWSQVVSAFVF